MRGSPHTSRRDPEHLTDLGNAERLVRRHGQDIRFCFLWRGWFAWDGTRWAEDDTGRVARAAKDTIRHLFTEAAAIEDRGHREELARHALRSEAGGRLEAMISLAESEPGIPIRPAELDADPWAFNVSNGTLDLRTGGLREHRREDLITKLAPVAFDPAATCPRWLAFLERIFAGNQDIAGFVQRLAGYGLTGGIAEHILSIFYGPGSNGKTTLCETLLSLWGDYGGPAAPDLLMAKRDDTHPTGVADLHGKRLVVSQEVGEGRRLHETLVKQLTGGDTIKARRMRQDYWQFRPTHKLILYTNHKPIVRGTDHAIWRRIALVPFTVTIPEEEQDKELTEKLAAELPGILNWALEGCRAWQQGGLRPPPDVRAATEQYRQEEDDLGEFLAECTVAEAGATIDAATVYQLYQGWALGHGLTDKEKMTQTMFGRRLGERFTRERPGGRWRYRGLRKP
jgi:putative DNA primase/helicase